MLAETSSGSIALIKQKGGKFIEDPLLLQVGIFGQNQLLAESEKRTSLLSVLLLQPFYVFEGLSNDPRSEKGC